VKLARIDQAIEACEMHFKRCETCDPQVEAYLSKYLVILMYTVFEGEIRKMIEERVSRIDDSYLRSFIISSLDNLILGIKTSDLKGLLKRFSPDYKAKFGNLIKDNEIKETFFNNIVVHRNQVAHQDRLNASFKDLVRFYDLGNEILDDLREVLKSDI